MCLLLSLRSKGEFLLGIFSQPGAACYLLLICKRTIIIKEVTTGKIHRAGNELPHNISVWWQLGPAPGDPGCHHGQDRGWVAESRAALGHIKHGEWFTALEHQAGQCCSITCHQFCKHFYRSMLGFS